MINYYDLEKMAYADVEDEREEFDATLTFEPIDKDGEIVGVVMIKNCPKCGEHIANIFTNGDDDLECMAYDAGHRRYDDEDEDFDDCGYYYE